ncbi:hypothetical protein ASPACDRAFT_44277 [Aspergillus aculeatus ATCC 16872]|uniref:BTB domain-containing protein n=1 Tax=Aspergillus aculeatus (strain ATCC 16872 / CBS 172.66 / WB 5094) TaxID=690307 RepID=A0A1L9WR33_ASPA1|nr:uncharacterized protein ASPACDRAFT_44277 [Aspergillus aculeatus ATCC 16872]OJJ98645.1 hypothetical protein ASPACDRAFT_44277 [Aspergillus aculeatus ATCC 16872]
MDTEFGEIISSPLFTFIVGRAKKEITVHSRALASLSTTLDKLMNGEMIEAKTRRVDWSEVTEEATFLRLCEYAYARDYTPPPCSHREVEPPSVPVSKSPEPSDDELMFMPAEPTARADFPPPPDFQGPFHVFGRPQEPPVEDSKPAIFASYILPRKNAKGLRLRRDLFDFDKLKEQHWHDDIRVNKYAPKGNSQPHDDFTDVFVGHVELYILADRYGVLQLKELVKYKLAATLKQFTLCKHNVIDLVEPIQLLYQNTLPGDAMRTLIVGYVLSVLGQIGASADFQKLLAEGGEFVLDFWKAYWEV